MSSHHALATEYEARNQKWHWGEEEHPKGHNGGYVGFRLRQREANHDENQETVVHCGFRRHGAYFVTCFPSRQRDHGSYEIAEERHEERRRRRLRVDDFKHVEVNVHS